MKDFIINNPFGLYIVYVVLYGLLPISMAFTGERIHEKKMERRLHRK